MLLIMTVEEVSSVILNLGGYSLGTRPFVRGRRKGSGHHLTFELSPGRNVDLTNQKR